MRLRYLHLRNYPPIADLSLHFASGSPLQAELQRQCAIHFVVGVNGSGKSNLLRAVAEVFLAVADERLPPFPVSLIYELGLRGTSGFSTFVIDCPGGKAEASVWVAERWNWPDDANRDEFETAIAQIREGKSPDKFRGLIARGDWPQSAGTAMPKAVLAYTAGDLSPWRSIWSRNQNGEGFTIDAGDGAYDSSDERPAGWNTAQETVAQAAHNGKSEKQLQKGGQPSLQGALYRRPILLDPISLKCALLAVALPHALIEVADSRRSSENAAARSNLRANEDDKTKALQGLLEHGGWRALVSVGFCCRLQFREWNRTLCETAHDWLLCAGEVISEPHPTEARRILHFDLDGRFSGDELSLRSPSDDLSIAANQGEALLELLGGSEQTNFEIFSRLLELRQAGLFDDVALRLRRQVKPGGDADLDDVDRDIGILRYEELSDGEQMFLGRMALFHLLRGQEDALLLLDEPETHFNDKWKREIVDIIDEAIGNAASEVLISTHSAIVLSDVFNDEIVMVEPGSDGSRVRPVDEPTFATDPSALMMTVFGADDSIGKRAQEFIEKKLSQSKGSQQDIDKLEQLIARMGSGFYRSELRTLLNLWRGSNA